MPRVLTLLGLMLAFAAAGQPLRARAHEASPPASPIVDLGSGACVGPPVLAGTPAALGAGPAPETPAVTDPETTPQASPGPSVPADQEVIARVQVAEHNLINCLNAKDYDTFIALYTPEALLRAFGTTDPAEAAATLESAPPAEQRGVENVRVLADGRISAEVTFTLGDELQRSRHYWVDREGTLLLDGFDVLSVPEATPAA